MMRMRRMRRKRSEEEDDKNDVFISCSYARVHFEFCLKAVATDDLVSLNLLLEYGAVPSTDIEGRSPVSYAVTMRKHRCLLRLLQVCELIAFSFAVVSVLSLVASLTP